jgi:hypothetical protein
MSVPTPAPSYRVRMREHVLADGRWRLPERRATVPAASVGHAKVIVVSEAHGVAGVPPWRGCVRQSLRYATAEPVDKPQTPRRLTRRRTSSRRARVKVVA